MIVVADTTPLNYLILIGHIEVLPALYHAVLIPPAVRVEMLRESAPAPVKKWIADPPLWLRVQTPLTPPSPELSELGAGENEAIRVALEVHPLYLIIDEVCGRRVAKGLSLPVIGTLGILKVASRRGMIDLRTALDRLRTTNFHLTPDLLRSIEE